MCVQTATNQSGVLSNVESALNTEASATSKPRLKLLCNPQRLPLPPYPQPKKSILTTETARIVNNYFGNRYRRLESVARDKGWIR